MKRDGIRSGFSPGESGAALALASESLVRELGLASCARVVGAAEAHEQAALDSDEGSLGRGLHEAVSGALAGLDGRRVDTMYGDFNGERHRAEEWAFVALRNGSSFVDPSKCLASAGAIGDVGAASGILGCVRAIHAWQRGYEPGPLALVWGSSWHGLRAAVLLERERV